MNVRLLAGVYRNGQLLRDARLRPLTGELEQQLFAVLTTEGRTPVKVSQLICRFVDSIGNLPVSEEVADLLCPVDRQLLTLQLARLLEGDQVWLHPNCSACGEKFDVGYQRSQLPVKTVSEQQLLVNWQYGVELEVRRRRLVLRPPNGADQIAICDVPEQQAMLMLLERLVLQDKTAAAADIHSFAQSLSDRELDNIAETLEGVSPQLANEVSTACPACGDEQKISIDPYRMTALNPDRLWEEVHCLAINYHWSEASILGLSREKRRRYIDMINQSSEVYE